MYPSVIGPIQCSYATLWACSILSAMKKCPYPERLLPASHSRQRPLREDPHLDRNRLSDFSSIIPHLPDGGCHPCCLRGLSPNPPVPPGGLSRQGAPGKRGRSMAVRSRDTSTHLSTGFSCSSSPSKCSHSAARSRNSLRVLTGSVTLATFLCCRHPSATCSFSHLIAAPCFFRWYEWQVRQESSPASNAPCTASSIFFIVASLIFYYAPCCVQCREQVPDIPVVNVVRPRHHTLTDLHLSLHGDRRCLPSF